MKKLLNLGYLLLISMVMASSLPAQTAYQPLSDQQLDQLIGPIALYPDPLIAEILPAATFPTQIVLADRYLQDGGDASQIENQPWDASVQAVAHYPTVLKWLDDNLDWTTELGQAFVNQQQDVMDSVQRLRATAQNLGNLQSTPQEDVIDDGANIEIVPASPDVIYVPVYVPDQVYYDSGGDYVTFGFACPIGLWLCGDFDWHNHHLFIWDHNHPRPANWWHETGEQHETAFTGHTTEWHPVNRLPNGGHRVVDRGYNNTGENHAVPRPVTDVNRQDLRETPSAENHEGTVHVGPVIGQPRVEASPVQHFTPAPRSAAPSSDTFIGIDNSRDTRSFSDRGSQSMGQAPRSAPEVHVAPSGGGGGGGSSHEGGGGGGGGGGGQRR